MKTRYLFASSIGISFPFLLVASLCAAFCLPRADADTAYAAQVVDYTPGTGLANGYTNTAAALGKPANASGGTALSPFSPNFGPTQLTGIGAGGQLTLALSNFVIVDATATPEIGLFGNVGLINAGSGPNGTPGTANPTTTFGVRSVQVSVSADGILFVPLNAGGLITSTLPANYYTNVDTTSASSPPPANPSLADFGKPFTGALSSFDGQSYAQILATLNGSAGGTWLDLSGTGLSRVGYIRFTEPAVAAQNGGVFYLDGVSINGSMVGAAVPEPGTWALLSAGLGLLLVRCWRGRRTTLGLALAMILTGWTCEASAQMFDFAQIKNWTGTGSNQAALVIDWNDSKGPESLAWGYRFNGTSTTGLAMFQAIDAADPRLVLFTKNDPSFGPIIYGIGYDLNNNGGTFTAGNIGNASTENGSASDPGDHYAEGFNTKYWAYYINDPTTPYNGASPYNGGAWTFAQAGAGSQAVVNGSWNGYSISDASFNAPDPGFPTAAAGVPEPSSLLAGGFGLVVIMLLTRRRAVRTREKA